MGKKRTFREEGRGGAPSAAIGLPKVPALDVEPQRWRRHLRKLSLRGDTRIEDRSNHRGRKPPLRGGQALRALGVVAKLPDNYSLPEVSGRQILLKSGDVVPASHPHT